MRLDTDLNSTTAIDGAVVDAVVENYDRQANEALREGVQAAQAGDRVRARTALLRAAELDPSSESAWLWLASISEYPEELLVFLNNVLEINPHNGRALEWMGATKSLLAKTFVQRGIDAAEGGQADLAANCFNQALENDQRNADAWLWLAKLADTPEGKMNYLEKVIEIDPWNEEAKIEFVAAQDKINQALLVEARTAAVSGRKGDANDLLDAFIAVNPDSEDGWTLRAHLADGFDEKIAAFERVLQINPSNAVAVSGIESLRSIMSLVAPPVQVAEPVVASVEATENIASMLEFQSESAMVHDKSPTQDLEFPVAAFALRERETGEPAPESIEFSPASEIVEESVAEVEPEMTFAPAPEFTNEVFAEVEAEPETQLVDSPEAVAENQVEGEPEASLQEDEANVEVPAAEWNMNTIAFSFAFPGGEMTADGEAVQTSEVENVDSFDFSAETRTDESGQDDALYETAEYAPVPSPASLEEEFAPVPAPTDEFSLAKETVSPEQPMFSAPLTMISPFEAVVSEPTEFVPHQDISAFEPIVAAEVIDEVPVTEVFDTESIPMPFDFSVADVIQSTGFETTLVKSDTPAALTACPFCHAQNPTQAFTCGNCLATLTLSDLEMLLANSHADKSLLRSAVKEMESHATEGPLSEKELTNCGVAYLNLRDFDSGLRYLQEASQLNPNNVVLGSQINSLLIRLDEIKRQEEAAESMPKEKKILVVDDSATVRKLIAGKLQKCGHEVYSAADGVEALEQLEKVTPDLVLLDITMPRMDGYQVCKAIRGNDAIKDIPVVMISGKDGFFDKVRGRMAGSTGYITKPFGPETLMKAVETYLSGSVAD